jgi:hypothetical protein
VTRVWIFSSCIAFVVAVDLSVAMLGLWRYRSARVRALDVLVSALVVALASVLSAEQRASVRFAAGAAVGLVHEALNLYALHLFEFPDGRLLFIRNRLLIVLAAGLPWGLIPLLSAIVARSL